MVDDQIKVTHDNNGRFYRIKMDLAKEGSEIWDLTPYFKGRVGDNRFGLQVVWTYQGRLLDTTGMKPYIEGNVGNYSFDDKKDLQLAPDAATVRYTGNPSDCQSGGRATYYFPEQMFPRDGIFKGYIGLLDDRDDSSQPHISGVTVWFRVLPGIAQMGYACDVYISDLDKALQNFKVKLDQHDKDYQTQLQQVIDDARNAYESETKNAHDAAVAAVAELNRTREDNNNLADLIQSIENNIKANNIVTRPEYDKLANEIVNRLSQINTKPDYYDNYNDMVAAKPNGTQDLCVTADNEHKWLYVNGQWLDLGEFSYADIAPALKNSLYSQEHGNVLVNPDMRDGGYGWNVVSPWILNTDNNIDNSQSYGIYVQNIPANTAYEIFQDPIPVYKHKVLSAGVKVTTNNAESADIQILFRDANHDIIANAIYKESIPANMPEWRTIKLENVSIPDNAVSAAFTIAMMGKGVVNICQPIVNFDPYLLPYSIKEAREQLSYNQDNVLVNPDMKNGAYGWNVVSPWVANSDNNIDNSQSYGIYVQNIPANTAYEIFQDSIPVYKRKVLSAGVKVTTNNAESAMIQVLFRDANHDIIANAIYKESIPANMPEWRTIKLENVSIPDNAVSAAFTIAMNGKGVVNICQPMVNFDPYLLPYSTKELRDQIKPDHINILLNPDLNEGAYGWYKDPEWKVDLANSVDNSSAYGIYIQNYDGHTKEIYQATIDVRKRRNFSTGVMVSTLNAERAELQVLLRDANGKIIDSTVKTAPIPQNTQGSFQLVKIEDQSIPAEAATGSIAFCMEGNGVLVVRQPRFNFENSLLPYSTKELTQKINIVEENLNNKIQNIESHNLPYFVFDIDVNQVQDEWITTPFTYNNGSQTLSGYAKIAIQGDSSRAYPKKNYKIKIFSDSECKEKIKTKLKSSWTKLSNFNLKANWIDATQSRNLVNAHLMSNATAVTPIKNNDVAKNLIKTQNFGQMEGFPIEVWFGDNYNGLYSCNTKKMDKVFGMDSKEKGTGVISVLDNVSAPSSQLLKVPTAKLDNVAYADELHDTPDPELVTNWSKWLDFLNNSTDDDFKSNIENYIDVKASINIYLFGVMSREYDYESKSILFLTWNNGKYYYPIAYDLDSSWGQSAGGNIEGNPQDSTWGFSTTTSNKQDGKYVSNNGQNKLFERLYKLFKPEIKAQYLKLRSTVWRTDQILNAFKDYMDTIPEAILEKDHNLWHSIPDVDKNDYGQLHSVITERCNQMDNWIEQLVPPIQPTPPTQTTQTGSQPTTSKPATTRQTTEAQHAAGQTATTATTDSKSTGTTTTDGK